MRDQPSVTSAALPVAVLASLAMLAFAANSLLCRLALQQERIDPASFATIRLASGALVLALVVRLRPRPASGGARDWPAAAMLFAYVAFFSFAYLSLPAGTGALVLFGAVQLAMLGAGLRAGEAFAPLAWLGMALAAGGLVYLVAPSVEAPPLAGAALMAAAGLAWGGYSLRGRGVADPLAATAGNFARAVPLALVVSLLAPASPHADAGGVVLAVVSGALTSGLGYVAWFAALRHLSAMRAAALQLSVPVLAALGGVVLLGEAFTPRLAIAAAAILSGIALVLAARSHRRQAPRQE